MAPSLGATARGIVAAATRAPALTARRARRLRRRVRSRRKTVTVYIDGFNFYRRALSGKPEVKWLDLVKMCDLLMPGFDVVQVRYFTAQIRALQGTDPRSPARQQAYLRALATQDRLSVHLGRFQGVKRVMDAHPVEVLPDGRRRQVKVRKIEEKQSDVSLAAYMVADAMADQSDVYLLLSSDSDFAGLLQLMSELSKPIGVISPIESVSGELRKSELRYVRRVRHATLLGSQLPPEIPEGKKLIRRPEAWSGQKAGASTAVEAPRPVAEASGDV
jgi:uncharacterized LabA/DUF88 family protein